MANNQKMRTESDLLGSVELPADVLYGVKTLRGIENFRISKFHLNEYPLFIKGLAITKLGAAEANHKLGLLTDEKFNAIAQACREIMDGKHHDAFPVDMIQGGAGTTTNMNANEVIANRALEIMGHARGEYQYCSPNDDVNCAQSTNDAYPTAIHLGMYATHLKLVEHLKQLIESFEKKAAEFADVLKMGRTQLEDAVLMTLGQTSHGFASILRDEIVHLNEAAEDLLTINMGATAIGTGICAEPGYAERCTENIARITGWKIRLTGDLVGATSDTSCLVGYASAMKRVAVKMNKICNDLRLLSSGPRTGFGEINLPPMQNGSSIMPGKINPVIPEVVTQVAFHVIGNDTTITMAAEAGQMELNAFEPVVFYSLFSSITSMTGAVNTLVKNCILGITANEKRCEDLVSKSVGITTALCPYIGYQKAASIAKKSLKTGESVTSLVLKDELLTQKQLDDILDPYALTGPELPAEDDLAG